MLRHIIISKRSGARQSYTRRSAGRACLDAGPDRSRTRPLQRLALPLPPAIEPARSIACYWAPLAPKPSRNTRAARSSALGAAQETEHSLARCATPRLPTSGSSESQPAKWATTCVQHTFCCVHDPSARASVDHTSGSNTASQYDAIDNGPDQVRLIRSSKQLLRWIQFTFTSAPHLSIYASAGPPARSLARPSVLLV